MSEAVASMLVRPETVRSKIVLLRHGVSPGNELGLLIGRLDDELSKLGEKQVLHAARCLKGRSFAFAKIYSSPSKRTAQSADIVRSEMGLEGVPLLYTQHLGARNYGDWEGLKRTDVFSGLGSQQVMEFQRGSEAPPNGEKFTLVEERVAFHHRQFIYLDILSGLDVLVVSHGGVLAAEMKQLALLDGRKVPTGFPAHGVPYVYEIEAEYTPEGPRFHCKHCALHVTTQFSYTDAAFGQPVYTGAGMVSQN